MCDRKLTGGILLLLMATRFLAHEARHVVSTTGYHKRIIPGNNRHYKDYSPQDHSAARQGELPMVMLTTLVKDLESWGGNRTFASYMDLVASFDYPHDLLSISILVGSGSYYKEVEAEAPALVRKYGFRHITILHRGTNTGTSRENRHDHALQGQRRRTLAMLRNFLLYTALQQEEGVLWLDADVATIPHHLLRKVVKSGKPIVAVRCMAPGGSEFDLNTWIGERKKPAVDANETQLSEFVPGPKNVSFLHEFASKDVEWIEVDSVGATFLYVQSSVHREGVIFPAYHAVGTTWDRDGYDAIESEGICYLAKYLGYSCWGLASEFTQHAKRLRS